jgi:hypothetical protein
MKFGPVQQLALDRQSLLKERHGESGDLTPLRGAHQQRSGCERRAVTHLSVPLEVT